MKGTHPLDAVEIGDGVTHRIWTDCKAGTVIYRTPTTILMKEDIATLLNGVNSGEPDALKSSPGGFCAHVEGVQRYDYAPDYTGTVTKFSRRAVVDGRGRTHVVWKRAGLRTREDGGTLSIGRHHHYDFNF